MKYFSVILASFSVVMCLVLAYFLTFTELFMERLDGNSRYIMIGVLLVYGFIRVLRIRKDLKNIKDESSR